MPDGHEIDLRVRAEVKRQIGSGRVGCEDCDNTGWRSKPVNPFMAGWEICPCWVGELWREIHDKLEKRA